MTDGALLSAVQVGRFWGALAWLSPTTLRDLTPLVTRAITSQVLTQTGSNGVGDYVVGSFTQYQIQDLFANAIASFASAAL